MHNSQFTIGVVVGVEDVGGGGGAGDEVTEGAEEAGLAVAADAPCF